MKLKIIQILMIILFSLFFVRCSFIGVYHKTPNFTRQTTNENGIHIQLFPQINYIEIKAFGRVKFNLDPISDSPQLLNKNGIPIYNIRKGKWKKNQDTLIIKFPLSSDYSFTHKTIIKNDSLIPSISNHSFDWIKK